MSGPKHARIECERCWDRPTPVRGAVDHGPVAQALGAGWSRSHEGAWICRSCLEPLLALETG